jgi:hypothetical protein
MADQQDRSDYFNWEPEDVVWEDPPQNPPPYPEDLPDGPSFLPDRFLRESGADRFFELSKADQDEALGPDVAEAVRQGKVRLSDLVVTSHMETESDFITQASPVQLGVNGERDAS